MTIPHRRGTQLGLITFAIILFGATGWAFVELQSVIPLIVLAIGMVVLWRIARVCVHVEVRPDELMCFQAFSTRSVPLSGIEKIVVDSSDRGTVTLHFSATKIRLMQGNSATRGVIDDIISKVGSVELVDSEDWYSLASRKADKVRQPSEFGDNR